MSGRILVADDDPATRTCLVDLLRHDGLEADGAIDGIEALAYLERQDYRLLITDYVMPKLNGLYLLGVSRVVWPTMPVVLVSGDGGAARQRALQWGAYAWISKPLDADQFRAVIHRALADSGAYSPGLTS
ncbi:response regulator [Candidatus Nitrospira bockiana]